MRRRRRNILATASTGSVLCAAALACTSATRASLVVGVEALTLNGSAVSNPQSVLLSNVGDVVTFRIVATVTGIDGTFTDEGFQSAQGSLLTTGTLLGNTAQATLQPPFNGVGSQGGSQQDLDGDGDLDVGSNTNTSGSGFVTGRAPAIQTSGTPISSNAQTFILGTSTFTLTSAASGGTATLGYRVRINSGAALWQEDGITVTPSTGSFAAGSTITFGFGGATTDLTLGNNTIITANTNLTGNLIYNGTTAPASVQGNLALSSGGHTFNIADGTFDPDVIISGVISGSASFTKTGNGTLTLTGANTYTNLTNINAGTVRIFQDSNLGTSGVTLNGGTLELAQAGTYSRPMSINSASGGLLVDATATFTGQLSGSSAFTVNAGGGLTLGGTSVNLNSGTLTVASGTLSLAKPAGSNAVAGSLVLPVGGTLKWLASNQIPDASSITLGGGTLDLNGNAEAINTLTISTGTFAIADGAAANDLDVSALAVSTTALSKTGNGTLRVTGSSSWSASGTALTIAAGGLRLNGNAGAGGRRLSLTASTGSTVAFGATQVLSNLTVNNGATVAMDAGGSRVLDTAGLSVASGGKLDLADNKLIVRYTAGNGAATLAALNTALRAGLNQANALWGGTGITSSAAAADATHLRGYALVDNSELGFTTFAAQSVDANCLLGMYTYYGDADLNGTVDFDDFTIFAAYVGSSGGGWLHGDFNYDGFTDRDNDFAVLVDSFYNHGGVMTEQIAAVINDIKTKPLPEPAALGSLAIAGATYVCSRGRGRRQGGRERELLRAEVLR